MAEDAAGLVGDKAAGCVEGDVEIGEAGDGGADVADGAECYTSGERGCLWGFERDCPGRGVKGVGAVEASFGELDGGEMGGVFR